MEGFPRDPEDTLLTVEESDVAHEWHPITPALPGQRSACGSIDIDKHEDKDVEIVEREEVDGVELVLCQRPACQKQREELGID